EAFSCRLLLEGTGSDPFRRAGRSIRMSKAPAQIRPAPHVRLDWRPNLKELGLMNRDRTSGGTAQSDASAKIAAEMAELVAAIAQHADRTAFARLFGYYAPRVKSYL